MLPLTDRKEIAKDTMAFYFDTTGTDFKYKAGQHSVFTEINPPETDEEGSTRTFTICSSPHHKDSIMIASRMRETAFKHSLKEMPLGTKVKVFKALGTFTLPEDASKPVVFLAGGIGVTPFHSMIEWATHEKLPHRITLFYSNKEPEETAFLKEFEAWMRQNPNLKVVFTVTRSEDPNWKYERGRIDKALLEKHIKDLKEPLYYVAGPPGMVEAMAQMLKDAGVPEERIKTEEFTGY
jgi:ferredoxin-NADP reductase